MNDPREHSTDWLVDPSEVSLRLDVAVFRRLEDVSRARIKRWIEEGRVRVNGEPARPSRACREGERIDVTIPAPVPAKPLPEAIPLDILFEDTDILVLNKPSGMVVHPGPGHGSGTLVNALLAHCDDLSGIGGVERPGIVHRLDKGTTGVLIVAKHDRAHQGLARAFEERRVDKRYLALAHGHTPATLTVDLAIGRDPFKRTKISSRGPRRREALTEIATLETFPGCSLLEIRIHTGRTHQIRAHLSEAGFPLVGDGDYGAPSKGIARCLAIFPRPALHAQSLSLEHPMTGATLRWEAPIPDDLRELRAKLSNVVAE